MKVKATYVGDKGGKTTAATASTTTTSHPRAGIDSRLSKNYPGRNLEDLDTHNVPIDPGKEDSPADRALRKEYKPSVNVGQRTPINNMKK